MKASEKVLVALCIAVLAAFATTNTAAAELVSAMITRIEPADTGIARVRGGKRNEEAAFMMPLYAGDIITVETPNTFVHVKVFGKDARTVTKGQPLVIHEAPESRGLFSSMYAALTNKVFRNNQLYRRNLTTRSDADDVPLVISGFNEAVPVQRVVAGTRSLFVRWNTELDSIHYKLIEQGSAMPMATGNAEGDFLFIENIRFIDGRQYEITLQGEDGRKTSGTIEAVASLPPLPDSDGELGTVGAALRLLGLADQEQGRWKLEAIQGVVDLSPDEIDRATLIDEISLL